MKSTITPFLQRYEEPAVIRQTQLRLPSENEITFVGTIYKSLLLDPVSDNRNRLTSCTKVLNETSDDE